MRKTLVFVTKYAIADSEAILREYFVKEIN